MPVSTVGQVGLGLSALGGLAQALGQNQRGQAAVGAAENAVDAAQQLQADNTAARQYFMPQRQQLVDQRQAAFDQLLQALGPERMGRFADNQATASGALAGGESALQDMLRRPEAFHQVGGADGLPERAAARLDQRYAPAEDLRMQGLARAMLGLGDARAQGAYADEVTDVGRQGQELQAAVNLRQAIAGREAGVRQQALLDQLMSSRFAGAGLGALGQFGGNVGLGLTHHVAFPEEPTVDPMRGIDAAIAHRQSQYLDPRAGPFLPQSGQYLPPQPPPMPAAAPPAFPQYALPGY